MRGGDLYHSAEKFARVCRWFFQTRTAMFLIIFIICASIIKHANASPWPRPQGDLFVSSGTDYFWANGDFLFDAPPLENRLDDRFTRLSSITYLEYGLTDHWQANFKLTYSTATILSMFSRVQSDGLSEIEGSLQRVILQDDLNVVSIGATVGRQNSLGEGVRPELASDGIDAEIRALYGRTLLQKPFKLFITAEAAYRRRFGTPADQIRTDVKIGAEPHPRILLLLDAFNTISLQNQDNGGADFDVLKVQPSIAVRIFRRWHIQSGANFEVTGRNLIRGKSVFINLWSEF